MNLMGQRIREKRLEKGLSLESLGKLLGVQRAAVSKWELGAVENISQTKIKEMAKIFDCSPSWLMGYDQDDGYQKVIDALTSPEPNPNSEFMKAMELYEQYKIAAPEVRNAIETLLKLHQSDP